MKIYRNIVIVFCVILGITYFNWLINEPTEEINISPSMAEEQNDATFTKSEESKSNEVKVNEKADKMVPAYKYFVRAGLETLLMTILVCFTLLWFPYTIRRFMQQNK